MNTLYYGDNLDVLRRKIKDESVDLCYIDPPFNSKRNYNQIYNNIGSEDKAQAQAFVDTWTWDTLAEKGYSEILANEQGRFSKKTVELIKGYHNVLGKGSLFAYTISMTLRITEIHRVLKPTGSFYFHCDPTVSHYIKLVLDSIFCGHSGDFRNEIIWDYSFRMMELHKFFNRKHDVVLFYSKSDDNKFSMPKTVWTRDALIASRKQKIHVDKSGDEWIWMPGGKGNSKNKMRRVEEIIQGGKAITDVWPIPIISSSSKERLGYPTQKPEALLERIIKASSDEGDVVLDAYCGCGTTVAVAERLKRKWIGIDITYQSISLVLRRLKDSFGEKILKTINIDGVPKDLESATALAHKQDDRLRKEFEKLAILTYSNNRAMINEKKGADKGIDGIAYFLTKKDQNETIIFQVKSGNVNRGDIAKLCGDMVRTKAAMAIFLTLKPPTREMKLEAKSAGIYHFPLYSKDYDKVQIVTIQDMLEKDKYLDVPLAMDVLKTAATKTNAIQESLFSEGEL